ncbi:MAG: hypothetical protein KAT70_03250 [Thermoplasmata archaeon]|nr:hypothetical protein [Thermoplasmata archaeon]
MSEEQEQENTISSGADEKMLSLDNIMLAGIIASSIGALWASIEHERFLLFVCFLLLALSLLYIRFPRSWASIFWIATMYGAIFLGTILFLGWTFRVFWIGLLGLGGMGLGLALGLLFIEHVKTVRDERSDTDYVILGLWSLVFLIFMGLCLISALGFYLWAKNGSLVIYLIGEVGAISLLPYIFLKVEEVGAGLMRPEDLLFFGEEKCPACEADLLLETRKCPSCGASRLFKWCTICESYATLCPECKERSTWLDRCISCNTRLPHEVKCKTCEATTLMETWKKA